eukprot:scaffold3226_cov160-Amphora_coffeaeformis.AAC.1
MERYRIDGWDDDEDYKEAEKPVQKKKQGLLCPEMEDVMQTMDGTAKGEVDDFFVENVVGETFFHDNNGQARYDKCRPSISKRLRVDELVERKIHMESCRPLVVRM